MNLLIGGEQFAEITHLCAAACCTPHLSPSAVQKHGSSCAPSAAPAGAGNAGAPAIPDLCRHHVALREEVASRQLAILRASIWSFFFLAAAIDRSITGWPP